MQRIILGVLVLTLTLPSIVDARQRTRVVVQKPYPTTQPVAPIIYAVIPLGILYDMQRRTDCRGDVLGMGGAGFDAKPTTGNFLIPASQRSVCIAAPK